MKRVVLTLLCATALTACVSPATYGPASAPGRSGFSEQRIEEDRFRVNFHGAGASATIQDYALLRASELTLQAGYDWFQVVSRHEEANGSSAPYVSVGGGTGSANYGRSSVSGVGVGLSTGFDLGQPVRTISLEIKLGKGPAPHDAGIYDARSVSESVHGRMTQR